MEFKHPIQFLWWEYPFSEISLISNLEMLMTHEIYFKCHFPIKIHTIEVANKWASGVILHLLTFPLQVLAPIFSFLLPRYQISAANKKGRPVSRDPEALIAKYSDPLVYTGSIRVRTGYEILRITSYLQQNLRKLRVPFLVLHGTADTVTDPEASQKLYAEASSTDKTIKLFDGFLHDLLFEPEREAIMKDIIEWLNCRVWCKVLLNMRSKIDKLTKGKQGIVWPSKYQHFLCWKTRHSFHRNFGI